MSQAPSTRENHFAPGTNVSHTAQLSICGTKPRSIASLSEVFMAFIIIPHTSSSSWASAPAALRPDKASPEAADSKPHISSSASSLAARDLASFLISGICTPSTLLPGRGFITLMCPVLYFPSVLNRSATSGSSKFSIISVVYSVSRKHKQHQGKIIFQRYFEDRKGL